MADALEHYQAGRLNDAVAAAVEQVKNKPGDLSARLLLCEMLCFAGDLERADKHLDLIAQQEARAVPAAALFRQLIRAELARRQFFADGRLPEVLVQPSEETRLRLAASVQIRAAAAPAASELLAKADEAHAASPGTAGGKAFDDLRDLDDLIASVFEVLTPTGKYYWVPINRVRVLEFRAPECTRDLLWRPARMAVEDGPDGEVYLPALYISSHASPDDRVRLGRVTEWQGGDGTPVRGLGQRMFLVGEDAQGIGDLGSLEFTTAGTAK